MISNKERDSIYKLFKLGLTDKEILAIHNVSGGQLNQLKKFYQQDFGKTKINKHYQ